MSDRLLILDPDTIVTLDVGELQSFDLGTSVLAAAREGDLAAIIDADPSGAGISVVALRGGTTGATIDYRSAT